MADVAAVALEIWDRSLPPAVRSAVANGLAMDEADARLWAAFLAGVHDLGKASRPFQQKDDPNSTERLRGSGLDPRTVRKDPGHGTVLAAQLPALLKGRGVPHNVANQMATLAGGHHGIFPTVNFARGEGSGHDIGESSNPIKEAWSAARRELFDALWDLLGIERVPQRALPNAAAMALAGLISVSDWIGSISEPGFFEYTPAGAADLDAYFERSRTLANGATRALHWRASSGPAEGTTFEALFKFAPRPLQAEVMKLPLAGSTGVVIVEAPMGEGKTEAALSLADRWQREGASGLYVALPTQATANQMHGRVAAFLARSHADAIAAHEDVNLVLAHGGAGLMDDLDVLPAAIFDEGRGEGAVAAGEWFLKRKRALLAPYGVGTIDQALLAVLQVKHVFVRLFGLAGKPVIIDEVHAYDTYMTGLLERLLEWLGAMGSPVVLLSATLPSARRQKLVQAYAAGATGDADAEPLIPEAAYPRITWAQGTDAGATAFPADERSRRTLELDTHRVADAAGSVTAFLQEELAHGGCAVVICNTVLRAQETYEALREVFEVGEELGLFHARFVAGDRQRIERHCLDRFGKPDTAGGSTAGRPAGRYVLVATQVVEQSLDLDFDVMVTDIAPVDLLLQRSGRLQRHARSDRRGPAQPALHIRWPDEDEEGLPDFDPGTKAVYDEHILLRTWQALRGRPAIEVPDDIQALVDRVYDDGGAVPEGAGEALASRWRRTWDAMEERKRAEEGEARLRRLRRPLGDAFLTDFLKDPREEDAPDLHPALQALTRLGAPSVEVVLLPEGSPLIPSGPGRLERARVRESLQRAVSVSARSVTRELAKLDVPPSFAATAGLRHHRLLVLDQGGEAATGRLSIRYDAELGLRIVR